MVPDSAPRALARRSRQRVGASTGAGASTAGASGASTAASPGASGAVTGPASTSGAGVGGGSSLRRWVATRVATPASSTSVTMAMIRNSMAGRA